MFRKTALTGLIAFAIAAAPVATPAFSRDNSDRFLIGLAALGILGAIVHENNKKDRGQVYTHQRPRYNDGYNQHRNPHRHGTHVKPKKRVTVYTDRHRHGNLVHRHDHSANHHRGDHANHNRTGGTKHITPRKRVNEQARRQCLRKKWTKNGWVKFYDRRCIANNTRRSH